MTNPKPTAEMKEKIIEILNKYQSAPPLHNEGTIDPMDFYKVADDIDILLASEVDRVIEERMPSEEEIQNASTELKMEEKGLSLPEDIKLMHEELLRIGFIIGAKFSRNRIKGKQ